MPDDPEVLGLLALMLLHDARRSARTDAAGELVTLEQQDRSRWDTEQISAAVALLEAALRRGRPGIYQVQAAIAACHATAPDTAETDWAQIVGAVRPARPARPESRSSSSTARSRSR